MAISSCVAIDDSFGPHAKDCRGGFDLTLLFEETILSVLIISLLLIAVPCRIIYLLRKDSVKVEKNLWLYWKVVSGRWLGFVGATMAIVPAVEHVQKHI